ncbi:hypothetical protein EJV46_12160 [Roseococcus sp. SYP-B2431]|uniref:hypothetical protein n=1 Tax=Roseococcus sp. SYP-B2431 TaxID=2496640 RepID=UPI00103A4304|nr:hypothetical protein [Roseococcus sp. SYP-B2431]TCH97963.1 hypothetical protein EJV46_12160 [Roseococcus sp. SYP-B2431]
MTAVAPAARPAHRRHLGGQRAWIVFGGRADHLWQRLLRRGFRHCFAALEDPHGWTVLDPLTGRLLVARLEVPAGFDLPGFYRRAGLLPVGPFPLEEPVLGRGLRGAPFSCVAVCRAVLGPHAPFAMTPHGLFHALVQSHESRKKYLTSFSVPT